MLRQVFLNAVKSSRAAKVGEDVANSGSDELKSAAGNLRNTVEKTGDGSDEQLRDEAENGGGVEANIELAVLNRRKVQCVEASIASVTTEENGVLAIHGDNGVGLVN
jgi:hypothetical protein